MSIFFGFESRLRASLDLHSIKDWVSTDTSNVRQQWKSNLHSIKDWVSSCKILKKNLSIDIYIPLRIEYLSSALSRVSWCTEIYIPLRIEYLWNFSVFKVITLLIYIPLRIEYLKTGKSSIFKSCRIYIPLRIEYLLKTVYPITILPRFTFH